MKKSHSRLTLTGKPWAAYILLTCALSGLPCSIHAQNRVVGQKKITLMEILSIGNEMFTQVGEITTDADDCIYVTDEYQYQVKKFNDRGKLVQVYGKRGNQPGQFLAGPYEIQCLHDTLAIVGQASSTIQFFTKGFIPLNDTRMAGVVVDFCLTHGGEIFSSTIQNPSRSENALMRYSKNGAVTAKLTPRGIAHDPILDMMLLSVDDKNCLVVAYLFMNRILVYDSQQNCVADFTLASLPPGAVTESDLKNLSTMPDNLVSDVAVDGMGNIFILGGMLSPHPNRDVYVTDYHGILQTHFLLPDQTGILYLDRKGHLFTREKKRSIVKKYGLQYLNF